MPAIDGVAEPDNSDDSLIESPAMNLDTDRLEMNTRDLPKAEQFGLDDLIYELPDELIAQTPSAVRHESRLMVLNRSDQRFSHHIFRDIKSFLSAGDVLVVNDTRVVPSRIFARRRSGGIVRMLLIRPLSGSSDQSSIWEAMVTPIKRLQIGEDLSLIESGGQNQGRDATDEYKLRIVDIIHDQDGFKRLLVDLGAKEDVFRILTQVGFAPLPPYIMREKPEPGSIDQLRSGDLERYQTVYAAQPGAVAAPTAGLHFSEQLLDELKGSGVQVEKITLHVGPGTFKPISTDIGNHSIEPERFFISEETASSVNRARSEGRRIIAVGTTTLRALETAGASGRLEATGEELLTSLYVKPGFSFKIVDGLVTNFHLSKSSLLVLVATFAGKDLILSAYREAVAQRYRFFSYGDAMLII